MFRVVSILTAVVCASLFVLLLVSPASYVVTYGMADDAGAEFMVRRASPMFAGFAVILWLCRGVAASPVRTAVSMGVAVSFAGIAATGVFAYFTQGANEVILAAAAGEVLIAILFVIANRDPRTDQID